MYMICYIFASNCYKLRVCDVKNKMNFEDKFCMFCAVCFLCLLSQKFSMFACTDKILAISGRNFWGEQQQTSYLIYFKLYHEYESWISILLRMLIFQKNFLSAVQKKVLALKWSSCGFKPFKDLFYGVYCF